MDIHKRITEWQAAHPTNMRASIVLVGALLALAAPASAQVVGSLGEGHKIARATCAECHGVEADDLISPRLEVPTFADIANKPGINAMSLSVWFRSPHPTMPNFIFNKYEASHLIVYILSLKQE